jgi:hypothetical protein
MKRLASALLLLLLTNSILLAQSGWFPFTIPWDDDSKTLIDGSNLLVDFPGQDPAAVIEARGFVRAGQDGHFYFEKSGRRAKFWGVNFTFNADFPPCPDEPLRAGEYPDTHVADKVARHLAKLGVNVVRFHHMDFFAAPNGIFDPRFFPNDTQHLDPGQLRRLDYLIYQLRRNGIYANLNLKVARHFGAGDGIADSAQFTGGLSFFQGVSHFNARMIELQKDYARQLLMHRNPYTGLAYNEDPGILNVEIANEDSLFGSMLNDGGLNFVAEISGSLPRRYSEELDERWNRWLAARYGNHDRLRVAWKSDDPVVDGSDKMRNGGFENGMSDWTVQQIPNAQASAAVETGSGPDGSAALKVQVAADGINWHVQAFQNGHGMERGRFYEMTFWAKAAGSGEITIDVMKGAPPWQNYGLSKTFQVGTAWTRFSARFLANESDGVTVRPTFELGAKNNTVWIDQVEFRQSTPRDFDADENLDSGSIRRPYRSQLSSYTEARIRDLFRFYSELDESYFVEMRRFLKEDLELRSLVTGTAPWWDYLGDTAIQSKMDFIDGHYYWDHPFWVGVPAWSPTGWRIRNQPQINDLQDLAGLAAQAVEGKPFTVSEYNYVFPNRYALEGPLLMALIANLQDWDAVYLFDYAGSTAAFDDAITTSFFSQSGNPVKSAQLPVAARIFILNQNISASNQLVIELTRDELAAGYARGLVNGASFLASKGLDRGYFLQSKIRIGNFDRIDPVSIDAALTTTNVTSSSGELRWDREDAQRSWMRVTARGVQGAIGFLKGRVVDLGDWSFQTGSDTPDHLAVLLQSGESGDIRESRRLILSVWTEHQNTDMVWNDVQTSVENRWGRAPALVRPAKVDLAFKLPASAIRIHVLDEKGQRKGSVSGESVPGGARFQIDTGRDGTLWYEVEILGKSRRII